VCWTAKDTAVLFATICSATAIVYRSDIKYYEFSWLNKNNSMIPMGTVVTVCMITGVVMAAGLPLVKDIPVLIKRLMGLLVLAAGLWNVFWYGFQHFREFWGMAALLSGTLMIVTAIFILDETRLPAGLRKAKPVVLVLLLGCSLMYGITIARL
jgi:hypothetical protein